MTEKAVIKLGELVEHVPDFVLQNILIPQGTRYGSFVPLAKKRKSIREMLVEESKQKNREIDLSKVPTHYLKGTKHERSGKAETRKGNLANADYRYWVGHPNAWSRFARCRACGETFYEEASRKLHESWIPGMEKCTNLIVAASKALLEAKPRLCVVCGEDSWWAKWGFPMHKECLEGFMFGQQELPGLMEELHRIEPGLPG